MVKILGGFRVRVDSAISKGFDSETKVDTGDLSKHGSARLGTMKS